MRETGAKLGGRHRRDGATRQHARETTTTKKRVSTKNAQVDLLTKARFQQNRGLGGLVISPTRELSLQIYNVLRELVGGSGASHTGTAGDRRREPERRGGTTREGCLFVGSDAR